MSEIKRGERELKTTFKKKTNFYQGRKRQTVEVNPLFSQPTTTGGCILSEKKNMQRAACIERVGETATFEIHDRKREV